MYDTSREAYSRSGGKVVVAIMDDQWFLDFTKDWKNIASECLEMMQLIPEQNRKRFEDTFEWLDKRPVARKRGIGTQLPQDPNWIIESLSDSVIYMSFYTIKHLIDKHKIKPEQLTEEFFDFIYNSKGNLEKISEKTKITRVALEEIKDSFEYWYPNDHRHTYVAHLSNHLSFFIFAHAALFRREHWPKAISFHGMVVSEGMKMSKSKGNVISLLDIKEKYGADNFRAYICTANSLEGTFDWKTHDAIAMQKTLSSLFLNLEESIQNRGGPVELSSSAKSFISKFHRAIRYSTKALDEMRLRDYAMSALYGISNSFKKFQRRGSKAEQKYIHSLIMDDWIRMLAPLIPHIAEELWEKLGNKDLVSLKEWPSHDESLIDENLEAQDDLISDVVADIRQVQKLAKIEAKKITIIVASKWKYDLFTLLKKKLEETRDPKQIIAAIMGTEMKQYGQLVMKLVPSIIKDPSKIPTLIRDQGFEAAALNEAKDYLKKEFSMGIEILLEEAVKEAKQAYPGKPAILLK